MTDKKSFDIEIFKNPGSEYRSKPFWAWNYKLDKEDLLWQIDILKKMGFGGFHMHSRLGLATEYMGEEFMDIVASCVKKAKEENMLACLYDEDRWPSGYGAGKVTKNRAFSRRNLVFTVSKKEKDVFSKDEAVEKGLDYLVGCFDICLDEDGRLENYRKISEDDEALGQKWYAYCVCERPSQWFCYQTYVDVMNKNAIDSFIAFTHEKYKEIVGDEFGKTILDIFTDEPCPANTVRKKDATDTVDCSCPWSYDFEDTFFKKYKINIVEYLPEIFWELKEGYSYKRYCYRDHIAQRFAEAFADNIGNWCEENNICFTGHFNGEDSLTALVQTAGIDVMRGYRGFRIPGVDILCDYYENILTLKQVQSAAHQYGKTQVMAELYGVTGWNYSFKGHKRQGDYLAALGITERVHHLSWASMRGDAKRDYPATINYQSPWYDEYSLIEDHFARLNTALTAGKPVCDVGIIHNIESMWLVLGPENQTEERRLQLEKNIISSPKWLLQNTVDFDYICESTLPEIYVETDENFKVGEMEYKTIIVPACVTLRKTTVDCLKKFKSNGGHLVFVGECPGYVDAQKSDYVKDLYNSSEIIENTYDAFNNAVSNRKTVSILNHRGDNAGHFVYNMRKCDGELFLFIANSEKNVDYVPYLDEKSLYTVKIKGEFYPRVYNTLNGEIEEIEFEILDGCTLIKYNFYEATSLLLNLKKYSNEASVCKKQIELSKKIKLDDALTCTLEEENVCVLDIARSSFNGEEMQDKEEILRINDRIRGRMRIPTMVLENIYKSVNERVENFVELEFEFLSEIEIDDLYFASEELVAINVNGKDYPVENDGYYVDKSIIKHKIGNIKIGENKILAKMPVSRYHTLEWCYLLGEFDVKVDKTQIILTKKTEKVSFGNIVPQGKAFYGGNIIYNSKFTLEKDASILVTIEKFRGYLVKVFVDGEDKGDIAFDPYNLKIENLRKGEHEISFKLYGTRNNTFGALHMVHDEEWMGPNIWYTKGDNWSYEYNLKDVGIIEEPTINIIGE